MEPHTTILHDDDENLVSQPANLPETNPPPAELCNMCGKCCRMATPGVPHQKLVDLAAAGNESAQAFLDVFIPFESVEAARQAMPDHVARVEESLKQDSRGLKPGELRFYHCRHIQPDNRCGIYNTRPVFCQQTPRNGWMVMPPGCGYEGWQFAQREQQKLDIGKLKELLQFLEALSPDGIHHPLRPDETLEPLRQAVEQRVQSLARFGSATW